MKKAILIFIVVILSILIWNISSALLNTCDTLVVLLGATLLFAWILGIIKILYYSFNDK